MKEFSLRYWFLLLIIGICDSQSLFLMIEGITKTTITSYSILIATSVPGNLFFSKIFLKKSYCLNHYIGSIIVIIGVFIAAFANYSEKASSSITNFPNSLELKNFENDNFDSRIISNEVSNHGLLRINSIEKDLGTEKIIIGDIMIIGAEILLSL